MLERRDRKRKGPKGPNPLSVKRKKSVDGSSTKNASTDTVKGKVKGKGPAKSVDGLSSLANHEKPKANLSAASPSEAQPEHDRATPISQVPETASANAKRTRSQAFEQEEDDSKGVTRPLGPGNSKKAIKRRKKKMEALQKQDGQAGGTEVEDAGSPDAVE